MFQIASNFYKNNCGVQTAQSCYCIQMFMQFLSFSSSPLFPYIIFHVIDKIYKNECKEKYNFACCYMGVQLVA